MKAFLLTLSSWFTFQQTDRASSSKGPSTASTEVLLVKLAEVEDLEEEVAEESNTASISSGSTLRPTSIPARTHKDSLREVSELEPIDEQSERLDSTSLEDAWIVILLNMVEIGISKLPTSYSYANPAIPYFISLV